VKTVPDRPPADRIEFRLATGGGGFDVVFDRPPGLEAVQEATIALFSDHGLPPVSLVDDRLTVMGADDRLNEIYGLLREQFQPRIPHTAYIAEGTTGSPWTVIYLFGRRTRRELEKLAGQIRERTEGGEIHLFVRKRRSHDFHDRTDRISTKGVRRPAHGNLRAWRELLLPLGIVAT
jgi:hypothetical protein